ncbi:MAG: excinuclease ABC subunit UvrB [Candidatus Kerfeldbacteria bacterium]|nr:excinuclease ABC subunit UvrB [Candidatus Kerfeldbacteria bacterium]
MLAYKFHLKSNFKPTGDQPQAIDKLVTGLKKGLRHQTLLGVTGSGKTFTIANVIARLQRPALVISHNKTLAAQLANEFRGFFPHNAVHYFVSYYDYYQPEAYLPTSDTYIEKESQLNEEIDRLRHAATQAILSRRDTIIVASVSCIYGLGSPTEYARVKVSLKIGAKLPRQKLLRQLQSLRYERNDIDFHRGTFRVKGEVVDIFPADALDTYVRLRYDDDKIFRLEECEILTSAATRALEQIDIYPASHYVAPTELFEGALVEIEQDMKKEVDSLTKQNKLLEAQRLGERTNFDLEMLRTTSYCNGIENYSRYFDGRSPGEPPYTLLDYLPRDALVFVDESHMTIPQIGGMFAGDRSRKETLIRYGFRLKAAFDNRPLNFDEFNQRLSNLTYISATPGPYERDVARQVVEQLLRPTGLLDPTIEVRPTKHQVDDLVREIKRRIDKHQRVLVTTLTKRMAEDLADFLQDEGIKVQYLHSEVDTFVRLEILRDLRLGKYDVVVGINLLREGLDLPEVSLIIVLDADKEGYLRSSTALVQTMGRAARHSEGHVIMYADKITGSMRQAIKETERRRRYQADYNRQHHITPKTIVKTVSDSRLAGGAKLPETVTLAKELALDKLSTEEVKHVMTDLERQMELAALNLEFERAAVLRDQIGELDKLIKQDKKVKRKARI